MIIQNNPSRGNGFVRPAETPAAGRMAVGDHGLRADAGPETQLGGVDDPGFAGTGDTGKQLIYLPGNDPAPMLPSGAHIPADDLLNRQWHLFNENVVSGRPGFDINLRDLWTDYDGSGVTIGVWDDGVEYTHPDLSGNYDTGLHVFVDGVHHDPFSDESDQMHGTSIAGLIAAAANGSGTVGVAHGATLAGVNFLSYSGIEFFQAAHALKDFQINNHSWGFLYPFPVDWGTALWQDSYGRHLLDSVLNGRGGLGSINVFSAGNNRENFYHTNVSPLTALPHTLVVGAVDHFGAVAYYSNPGSNLLVTSPSGSGGQGIWTTDRTGFEGYSDGTNETRNPDADYTSLFGGTSASTAIVSGVVALMLQANKDLGWRDVQEILAYTARHSGSEVGGAAFGFERDAWEYNGAKNWNGGGLHYSDDYGFGVIDAHAAVRMAETWDIQQTSANSDSGAGVVWSGPRNIPDFDETGIEIQFDVAGPRDVEAIGLDLEFSGGAFLGDYLIILTSPSGTESILAAPILEGGFPTWTFASKEFWGEDPVGTWTLRISDLIEADEAELLRATLNFHGGEATDDDIYVFTEEFSEVAGTHGHTTEISDGDGGSNAINAAAVISETEVDLSKGTALIDGQKVSLEGSFDRVFTGDGDDAVFGTQRAETVSTGRGSDEVRARAGADSIAAGAGDDMVRGGAGRDTIQGGEGDDELLGGRGGDFILGQAGDDTLSGQGGNDFLRGGSGEDVLRDDAGRDWMLGGPDADVFELVRDGSEDKIRDFTPGVDTIRMIGVSESDITILEDADHVARVEYFDETLIVDGKGWTYADLTVAEFDFA